MEIVTNIIWGLIFIAMGAAILKYFQEITENVGRFEFLEKFFSGATFALFMFIGFALIVLGILTTFGLVDNVLRWLLSPIISVMS